MLKKTLFFLRRMKFEVFEVSSYNFRFNIFTERWFPPCAKEVRNMISFLKSKENVSRRTIPNHIWRVTLSCLDNCLGDTLADLYLALLLTRKMNGRMKPRQIGDALSKDTWCIYWQIKDERTLAKSAWQNVVTWELANFLIKVIAYQAKGQHLKESQTSDGWSWCERKVVERFPGIPQPANSILVKVESDSLHTNSSLAKWKHQMTASQTSSFSQQPNKQEVAFLKQ